MKVIELKISPTNKRADFIIESTKLFSVNFKLTGRILSRQELSSDDIDDILVQALDRKDDFKKNKNNYSLSANNFNATIFLTKIQKDE